MSGQELLIALDEKVKQLNSALSEHRKRGENYAEARKMYQIELAKEILIQRNSGVPVTIILDICKGKTDIAELRCKKDIAESLYKSAGEAINTYKLQIRIIEGQIEREWGRR